MTDGYDLRLNSPYDSDDAPKIQEWRPIDEDTPRVLGEPVLCWRNGWTYPTVLVWKGNMRIDQAHAAGTNLDLAAEYFGDPNESDDYALAHEMGRATYYFSIPLTTMIVKDKDK